MKVGLFTFCQLFIYSLFSRKKIFLTVFVVINDDKRILHHVRPGKNENNFKVPLEVFESDDTIDLKFDLMDPGIAICSQAVPPLFQDHFDVQSLDDFVKEILQNDLTTNKLHLYEFGDDKSYASRIINFHTYFAAQLDVLHRWLHPIGKKHALKRYEQFALNSYYLQFSNFIKYMLQIKSE